jgi:uncharacterized protein YndB with AHSA1/START domain
VPAEQFLTLDGRPGVRVERRYPQPIEQVWRAITEPEHLGQWFPSPVEIDLRAGGQIRFAAFAGGPSGSGIVEEVEAPHRLSFTWGGDRLRFELAPSGGGTALTLVHSFDDRAGAASFATGWEQCLAGLRCVLGGGALPPVDHGIIRHEELVREFGLDRPEVSDDADRWTVRIERQLTCPAEVAWDLWFGTDLDTGEQRSAPGPGEPLTPYMAPDVVVGMVTEVERHRLLAFDVTPAGGPGDHLRLELADGTGHGARITVVVTGTDPDEREAAAQMWATGAVGHLAAKAAEWAMAQPVGT